MNRLTEISARQILGLLENCFDMIDPRLVGHELRTAGYADQLLAAAGVSDEQRRDLDCLAFLHDIGAYKTEEIILIIPYPRQKRNAFSRPLGARPAFSASLFPVFHLG